MKVELLGHTGLTIADTAIAKCYAKEPYTDLEKQQSRINRVANVSKHASTIEHLIYNFDIDGISRACLQELARHRLASYTVKSSRYTLQELRDENDFYTEDDGEYRASKYVYFTDDHLVNDMILKNLNNLRICIKAGISNDISKYCLPEAYKTSLVMTINARALQNFLNLRTDKHALLEIQHLAHNMYEAIPEEHKFLFTDYIKENR